MRHDCAYRDCACPEDPQRDEHRNEYAGFPDGCRHCLVLLLHLQGDVVMSSGSWKVLGGALHWNAHQARRAMGAPVRRRCATTTELDTGYLQVGACAWDNRPIFERLVEARASEHGRLVTAADHALPQTRWRPPACSLPASGRYAPGDA